MMGPCAHPASELLNLCGYVAFINVRLGDLVWIAFWFVGVPLVAATLFAQPRWRRPLLALLVFSTCHIKKPFYMELFFEPYRGVDRGFGVTIPDILFFGFLLYLLLGGARSKIIWWPYNTALWMLLVLISAISLTGSQIPYYGLFTIHKFIRGWILYWVIVNLVREKEDIEAVLNGLIAAVLFQGAVVLFDKYVTHTVVNRSVGSFPHPNSLAMYIDLIIPTLLALFLAGVQSKWKGRLTALAILLGMVCVIFTKSRAALVIMMGAFGLVTGVSVLIKPTPRKFGVIAAGLAVVTVIGALAAPRLIRRFQKAPKESEQTRIYFNNAARAMADEHLFGVGINAYSWMLGHRTYYWYVYPDKLEDENLDLDEFRASKQGVSRLGTAHHIYYLFAAETGWLGMWVFILYILRFYVHNVVLFFKARDDYYRAILLGLLAGFATLHLQGLLEWVFRQTQVFYLFFILSGLMVAIGPHVRRRPRRREATGWSAQPASA